MAEVDGEALTLVVSSAILAIACKEENCRHCARVIRELVAFRDAAVGGLNPAEAFIDRVARS